MARLHQLVEESLMLDFCLTTASGDDEATQSQPVLGMLNMCKHTGEAGNRTPSHHGRGFSS